MPTGRKDSVSYSNEEWCQQLGKLLSKATSCPEGSSLGLIRLV